MSAALPNPSPAAAPDPWVERVLRKCRESVEVKQKFFDHYAHDIGELSQKMGERFAQGHKLWVMGNGGSACDAQHVAVEFIHPIIEKRRALPALDLVSQIPVVTAISNDKDFARVFVDQIELWGQKDDMALAISTSAFGCPCRMRLAGSGFIKLSGFDTVGIPAMSWAALAAIGADETVASGSTTVSVPFIPASLWPGMEQKKSKTPGLSNVKSPVTV